MRTVSGLFALLLAAPALAAEHAEAAASPFAGDLGNALWTLIVFALVLIVLGKFAWGPILKGLQQREDFIKKSLEDARRDRDEAEKRLAEYVEKLNQARAEASAIVEEGKRDAEAIKSRAVAELQKESGKLMERARREIGLARDAAIKDVYSQAARLATDAASRIIGAELKPEDHARLIAEAIDQLERESRSATA
ncbi:MAG TPA: F0F1 ATP synthase subunit B [Thermoanaerobaculia bacterium]|nr:F0F1 ATP synthase subunit B [Thermoanaerobaculia bacterium]